MDEPIMGLDLPWLGHPLTPRNTHLMHTLLIISFSLSSFIPISLFILLFSIIIIARIKIDQQIED